jgi:hypothetical protein
VHGRHRNQHLTVAWLGFGARVRAALNCTAPRSWCLKVCRSAPAPIVAGAPPYAEATGAKTAVAGQGFLARDRNSRARVSEGVFQRETRVAKVSHWWHYWKGGLLSSSRQCYHMGISPRFTPPGAIGCLLWVRRGVSPAVATLSSERSLTMAFHFRSLSSHHHVIYIKICTLLWQASRPLEHRRCDSPLEHRRCDSGQGRALPGLRRRP